MSRTFRLVAGFFALWIFLGDLQKLSEDRLRKVISKAGHWSVSSGSGGALRSEPRAPLPGWRGWGRPLWSELPARKEHTPPRRKLQRWVGFYIFVYICLAWKVGESKAIPRKITCQPLGWFRFVPRRAPAIPKRIRHCIWVCLFIWALEYPKRSQSAS